MAFPSTPLDIRTELQLNGVWSDVSAEVYVRDPKEIDHGRRDRGARTDPGHLTLTFNNRDGKYSPGNPMSPLWGQIGQNTPIRLSVPGWAHHLELPGAADSFASTPDAAALDITGDLDLRWEGEANWYGPGARVLIGKWGLAGDRSYQLRLQDGALYLHVARDGSSGPIVWKSLPALPRRAALRAVLDADNGSGGYTVRHYWAPSLAGPWTQLAGDYTAANPVTIYASTAPLTITPSDLTTTPPRRPLEGRVYAAEVRNGIAGTVVASPNFEAQPLGTAAFADSAGRTWSYSGGAHISDRAFRFIGEVSEWPKEWQSDGSDVWSSVEASGVLRRYEQGTKALHSTLRRRIPSGAPIAYWPMEEDNQASRAYSPITGVQPAAVTGVEWAAVDTLPSSRALPRLTAAATLSAIVPPAAAGAWQVEMVYNADDKRPPAAGPWAEVLSVSTTGTVRRWVITMRDGSARIYGFDAAGTDVVFTSVNLADDVFHGWYRLRFYVQDLGGGTLEWVFGFANVNGSTLQLAKTITGTPGYVQAVTATWGALTEGWSIGHLSVMPTAASTIYDGSDSAYSGETAWERMRRLAAEENLPMARISGPLTPQRVGPQLPEKLVDLLQAAAAADGGMLLEDRDRLGLIYRDRSSLYTQEPALVLDAGLPGLAADDLRPAARSDSVRNDVTVKRIGGSEARAVLEEGRLSVQDPPLGIGLYDESLDLSLDDDVQAEPIAYWRLHLRTHEGAVYPAVSVMLHKPGAQALIPAVLALREGDLIRVTGLPGFVEFGDLDLIVEGVKERLDLHEWRVTFNCSPGAPWNTARVEHPVYGKAGGSASQLATGATATATVLDVQTTAGLPWTTDPGEMPILLEVGGEEVTASAIAYVADTFTRSVANGWGTSSGGQVWTAPGGSASERAVDGARGTVTLPSAVSTVRFQHLVPGVGDCEVRCRMSSSQVATGASLVPSVLLRYTSTSNYYRARLHFATGGALFVSSTRDTTQIEASALSVPYTYTAGAEIEVRARIDGHRIRMRVWPVATPEPAVWHLDSTVVTNPIETGAVGLTASAFAGSTNVNPILRFDNFEVVGLQQMTVLRSVNGVVKPHAAGAGIRLARPAIAPL
ncbi:hypothetical protein QFZ75_003694 [Streptomyces sp. V3I8]|uniref:hypothetical protein n=1 Tax=Streptomyces sp. V3I8 TaxID=3042279 RepID=UPI00278A2EBB|nr:hypothetical protein [Streptomyces sp. V3I8]MDQ1037278.1 hypothetical protein [Streptomyces sp. V3I8]